jgi:hypothetical protein
MPERFSMGLLPMHRARSFVPCLKHLPVNIQLEKRASKRVRVAKSR